MSLNIPGATTIGLPMILVHKAVCEGCYGDCSPDSDPALGIFMYKKHLSTQRQSSMTCIIPCGLPHASKFVGLLSYAFPNLPPPIDTPKPFLPSPQPFKDTLSTVHSVSQPLSTFPSALPIPEPLCSQIRFRPAHFYTPRRCAPIAESA